MRLLPKIQKLLDQFKSHYRYMIPNCHQHTLIRYPRRAAESNEVTNLPFQVDQSPQRVLEEFAFCTILKFVLIVLEF